MVLLFNIIVAMDAKNGIGKQGGLPWHLPPDLKHFRDITVGASSSPRTNVVIMGRKTWGSLPKDFRPLPHRLNIVLTKNPQTDLPEGVLHAADFEQAFSLLGDPDIQVKIGDIFVIGGAQVFQEALRYPECQKIYATHIDHIFNCDTFFPPFKERFALAHASSQLKENSLFYHFAEYIRS